MIASRRTALLALLLLLPAPSLGALAAMWWWPDSGLGQGVFLACKLWLLAMPAAWWLLVDRGRPSWSPPRHGGFGPALVSGLLIAAAIVIAWWIAAPHLDTGALAERLRAMGLDDPLLFWGMAAYWITINAVLEEYVWRWFVVVQGERLLGGAGAVALSALAFTVHHLIALRIYFDWPLVLLAGAGVCLGGVIWSWLYLRYRSIWPCWVSHLWADIVIMLIAWSWL